MADVAATADTDVLNLPADVAIAAAADVLKGVTGAAGADVLNDVTAAVGVAPRSTTLFADNDNDNDGSTSTLPAKARVRTFFAVALQLGRAFPALVELIKALYSGDRLGLRRAARTIARAILQGARDRGRGPMVRSAIDQQRRTDPLSRLRPSRPGRTPQAIAARARSSGKVTR